MEELILELIDYGVEEDFDEDEEANEITIYGDPKELLVNCKNTLKRLDLKLQVLSLHAFLTT